MMKIETERLILREYTEDDYSLFKSVYTDEDVMRYALADVFKADETIRRYFDKVRSDNKKCEGRGAFEFAIIEKNSGQYIGSGDIEIQMKNASGGFGEIGYFLLKPNWGKGYATEVAAALMGFGFKALGLHKVCASCNAQNKGSENVMKKLGMTKEGVFRKTRFKNNMWHDEIRYGILLDEWEKASEEG